MRTAPHGVLDEHGATWPSIRLAFWRGRLGMRQGIAHESDAPAFRGPEPWLEEQFETLIAVLWVAARGFHTGSRELSTDIFRNSIVFEHHYRNWLVGAGLLVVGPSISSNGVLTDEGWAVLLMLKATRPNELIDVEVGYGAIELAGGKDMVEIAHPAVDTRELAFVFEREDIANQACIVLIDRQSTRGRMPMRRTLWSASFGAKQERDRMFAWLCARSDRWDEWGNTARRGADALSQHLLATYISSVDWREPNGGEQVLALEYHTA